MSEAKMRIVTTGQLVTGFDRPTVEANLARLCRYTPQQLQALFSGQPFMLKGGLTRVATQPYLAALAKAGIVCRIEREQAKPASAPAPRRPAAAQATANLMSCPRCGASQPQSASCAACGIVIAKYNQRQQTQSYPEMAVETAYADAEPRSSNGMGVLTMLLVLIVVCVGGYFGYQSFFGNSREVIAYVIKDCEPCDEAVDYLTGQGIECTVYDVEESKDNEKAFLRKSRGKRQLPLLFVGSMRVDGNDPYMLPLAAAVYNGQLKNDGSAKVVVYCTKTCGFCKKTIRFLNENNVPFTECDITNPQYNQEYQSLQPIGTPLILIGDAVRVDGFRKELLTVALEEAGLM